MGGSSKLTGVEPRDLVVWLEPAADEVLVLSVICIAAGDGFELACGSALVGPTQMGAGGWPAWQVGHDEPTADTARDRGSEFVYHWEDGFAGRAVVTVDAGVAWLKEAINSGRGQAVGPLPEFRVAVEPPRTPLRTVPHSGTEAESLAIAACRPIEGYRFPRQEPLSVRDIPDRWDLGDAPVFNAAATLVGIGWRSHFEEDWRPDGLLVGRLERRCWINQVRLDPENDLFGVELRRDTLPDFGDLEIELEEWIDDELVISEVLRLEEVDLTPIEDSPTGWLHLPTIGRGAKRRLRLGTREGNPLDQRRPFNLVESFSISFNVNGEGVGPPVKGGEKREKQDLGGLLGAVARCRAQYRELRRSGHGDRLFENEADLNAFIRRRLERATGEILIVDPYFAAWSLLQGLPATRIRVLVGATADPPPPGINAQVARWRQTNAHPIAPFHDRSILWDDGGLAPGTSTGSGAGRREARVTRLPLSEVRELQERFTDWWSGGDFERLN